MLDPLIGCFRACFTDHCRSISRRNRLYEKCEEGIGNELEITALLGKVRESYEITRNLHYTLDREMLSFTKTKVIELTDTDGMKEKENRESVPTSEADSVLTDHD
jgi:hypothetical protein